MNELALFAGAGGGILGGKLLGWRTVCAVELDAYCRRVLLARQRDGFLPRFPIWDDVQTFDGKPWRGGGWTLSVGDSLAKTSALPISAPKASTETEAGCGKKWRESFVKFDPNTSSWKTRQHSLFGGLVEFSETWPRWGMMRAGECWALDISELGICVKGSGWWLPTIAANEGKGSSSKRYLGSADFRGAKMSEGLRTSKTDPTYLNPSFGEVAMGYPTGWTVASEPLATHKFQQWCEKHGVCSEGQCDE